MPLLVPFVDLAQHDHAANTTYEFDDDNNFKAHPLLARACLRAAAIDSECMWVRLALNAQLGIIAQLGDCMPGPMLSDGTMHDVSAHTVDALCRRLSPLCPLLFLAMHIPRAPRGAMLPKPHPPQP